MSYTRPTTRFVVHVGRHKAGTTSLQRFFVDKPAFLERHGYYYPIAGRRPVPGTDRVRVAHNGLADRLLAGERDLSDLFDEIRNVDHTILISGDALQSVEPEVLAEFFPAEDTTIVMYLREQVDYILSAYAEHVKAMGYAESLRTYAWSTTRALNYWANLRRWEDVFGVDHLRVRLYDRSQMVGGSSVDDFWHAMALNGVVPALDVPEANPSMGPELVALVRIANGLGLLDSADRRDQFYERQRDLLWQRPDLSGKIPIDPELVAELREVFAPGNSRTFKRYLPPELQSFTMKQFEAPAQRFELAAFLDEMLNLADEVDLQTIVGAV